MAMTPDRNSSEDPPEDENEPTPATEPLLLFPRSNGPTLDDAPVYDGLVAEFLLRPMPMAAEAATRLLRKRSSVQVRG